MQEPTPDATGGMTIVLADDHTIVRTGLRMLLDAEDGLRVVAEAGDVAEAVRKVRAFKPDVLVLDLSMPGGPSLAAFPSLKEASPRTAIVVLTMEDEPRFARAAMRAGALGFVLKEAADTELVQAVKAAAAGVRYLNPQLGAVIAAEPEASTVLPDGLSEREGEVLRLVALGYTNTEIAQKLFLSVRTVESHRAHIQQKAGATTRAELVAYARKYGVLES
jgi:two-component system, NarL family, response regulator NreC